MPAPASVEEFLDIIRKSGVTDEARFKSYLQRLTDGSGVPTEPNLFAKTLVRDGILTFFQADQLLQGKWKRFFIGKYKVLERLGSGGMGQVFLCEHKLMRRRVAVKVLPAAKASDPASLDRFYREARAVAAVDHPNIVRAYDIDQDDNLHFLVMEFVDGTNLHDLVKKSGPLDPVRAAHYMYGSAVGLHHAHEMGLVHRDIKPGNILIDRSGVVKILDLGLARFFNPDEDDLLTKKYDENILGTADYLSPEQAVDSHNVDIRSDLYSLGGTFYYLIAAQAPFPEGSVAQKLLWHQTREPAPLSSFRSDVPAEIAAVVMRLMEKKPEDRYQSPAELMGALAPWVQTPIPPPTDKEMPQFSLAAVGPMGGATSRILNDATASGSTMATTVGPRSDSHRAGGTVGGAPSTGQGGIPAYQPAAAQRTAATPAPAPKSAPVATAPTAVVTPTPEPENPLVWDSMTSETQTNAKIDTDRPAKSDARSTRAKPAKAASSKGRSPFLLLAIAGVGLFLVFGAAAAVGAYFAFFRSGTTTDPKAGSTWYVSKGSSPNPERTLATLRGAWEQVKSDETIVLLDERIDEPAFRLTDAERKKKNVRITTGDPNRRVTWATKSKSFAMMEVYAVEGLQLSNVGFDLANGTETAISMAGYCPGLTLEDVSVQNVPEKGIAIRFGSCNATADHPITLKKVRVTGAAKYNTAILLFTSNQYLLFDDCRFDGPAEAAVRVDGTVNETTIRNCRLYNFERGVWLTTTDPKKDVPFSLTIANTTFHTMTIAGILSDHPLNNAAKHKFDLSRDYFVATNEIVGTPHPALPTLKFTDNARDAATKDHATVKSNAVEVNNALPAPNPADDATFLRPTAGGPLSAVGSAKVPVGAPPK